MKINIYSVMLDGKRLPYLRLDRSVDYKRQSKLNEPGLMARMINEIFELEDCAEEHLIMVALDAKLKVLGIFQTAHGSMTATEVSVRGILQRALLCGAFTFIVFHNHPSGDCNPSQEDRAVAERLKEAGSLMQIPMSDFIIIGNGAYYSYHNDSVV